MFGTFFQDLRYAARTLVKSPGFTSVAVLTLALGIGLNTSMFSLMNALLLRPLPFPDAERLVKLYRATPESRRGGFSPADFLDLKRDEAGFGRFAAYHGSQVTLAEAGRPAELIGAMRVSADFFDVLGVRPERGRTFLAGEDVKGNDRVAVISHALWRDRFAGAGDVVGRTVRLDGEPNEIVGVLPESAQDRRLFERIDVFRPLGFGDAERATRDASWLSILGRRGPGVSASKGEAFVAAFGARLAGDFPAEHRGSRWVSEGLRESTMSPTGRQVVLMLLGLSGFVLLIACSNLANFLLARTVARAREFAVRATLGASRLRLVRPLVLECVLLAVAGGVGAVVVAGWAADWVRTQGPGDGAPIELATDWRVLGFAFGAAALTVLFFGVTPALVASRVDLNDSLKSRSRGSTAGRGHRRFRHVLIVGQFALTLVLIVSAGCFVRGADNVLRRGRGWDSDRVIQGQVQLPVDRYPGGEEAAAFYRRVIDRLEQVPGVEAAAVSYALPYRTPGNVGRFAAEGQEASPEARGAPVMINGVTPSYFDVTGTRLVGGRHLDETDTAAGRRVAVVNESMARAMFPGGDAVGKRVGPAGQNSGDWLEVVGVVADVRYVDVANATDPFQLYQPIVQTTWYYGDGKLADVILSARAAGVAPQSLTAAFREAVAAVDPDLPVRDLVPADTVVRRVLSNLYFVRELLVAFAALGLVLAVVGIYGVIARTVIQRTGEIGIRTALGARGADVMRLVLGSGLRLALVGAGIGLVGAAALSRLLVSFLPGMQTNGGAVLAAATVFLVVVALAACYLPARRAAAIDPVVALRHE